MSYTSSAEILDAISKVNHIKFEQPLYIHDIGNFNPIVYDNEPYTPAETIRDLLNDWLNVLNILRTKYLETNDERYASLLYDLMPAAIYEKINS